MVFENLTKSLKGVTTTLTNTVSDGFDSITSPIQWISNSITGANMLWLSLQEQSWHDEYKHWRLEQTKNLLAESCWSGLTASKNHAMKELMIRMIEQPLNESWSTWVLSHTKTLQSTRKKIKESKLLNIESKEKQKTLGKKMIALPQKDQTQRVLSFEEFVMNCQQRLREVENNAIRVHCLKPTFALDDKKESIHGYSKEITKKSFGIILDHGKLDALSHRIVKLLKKVESLQELQASSFDGEAKRYDKLILESQEKLSVLYTQERTQALKIVTAWYSTIASKSELIHTQWLEILAQQSQFGSDWVIDNKKKTKVCLWELKTRTKKVKLLFKKNLSSLSKHKKHISFLEAVSKNNEWSITQEWDKRKNTYQLLRQSSNETKLSYGATLHWQSHITEGFGDYMVTSHDTLYALIKNISYIWKQVESEYSLTQDLLKKLIRDLRKLHADINAQQSTVPTAQRVITDILATITLWEEQAKTLKTRKNETKKQTTWHTYKVTKGKKDRKLVLNWNKKATSQVSISIYTSMTALLDESFKSNNNAIKILRELWSNKKLSLPKTKTHESVWKAMRVLADSLEKESQLIQSNINRLTSKNESSKHTIDTLKKNTVTEALTLEWILV